MQNIIVVPVISTQIQKKYEKGENRSKYRRRFSVPKTFRLDLRKLFKIFRGSLKNFHFFSSHRCLKCLVFKKQIFEDIVYFSYCLIFSPTRNTLRFTGKNYRSFIDILENFEASY